MLFEPAATGGRAIIIVLLASISALASGATFFLDRETAGTTLDKRQGEEEGSSSESESGSSTNSTTDTDDETFDRRGRGGGGGAMTSGKGRGRRRAKSGSLRNRSRSPVYYLPVITGSGRTRLRPVSLRDHGSRDDSTINYGYRDENDKEMRHPPPPPHHPDHHSSSRGGGGGGGGGGTRHWIRPPPSPWPEGGSGADQSQRRGYRSSRFTFER